MARKRLNSLVLWPQWLSGISCHQYLTNFVKQSQSISEHELNEMANNLCLRMSDRFRGDSFKGPYRDAKHTFSLYRRRDNSSADYEYLACIGFEVENKKIVVVKQIQGNPGKGDILKLFKWERMLLAFMTDWSKRNGFNQIRIIQAKDQGWFNGRSEEGKKRMFMHYDVTARRSGFKFDQDSGQYIKDLF